MAIDSQELLKAAEMVVEARGAKATLKYSFLGAGITALTTFAGGLLAGPVGFVFGALGGGLVSYKATENKFRPLVTVLKEDLTDNQKEKLANHLQNAIRDVDISDFVKLVIAIQSQEALALLIFNTVKQYVEQECQMSISC